MEKQKIFSSFKVVPDKAIQFQHIFLYLFWKFHFHLSCEVEILMVLIFLKKQVYTQRMQMILYFFLKTKNL